MTDEWPFDQPAKCAVITLRQIVDGSEPILHVVHDADDHGWQFLTLDDVRPDDASVVGLGEIVDIDPTVLEVGDIAPGWRAWRQSPEYDWIREKS